MIYDSNKGMMEAATCNFQRLIFPYQPGMPPLPRPLPSNIDGPAGFPRANGAEYNGYEAGNRYNNLNSQSRYNRHRNPRTGHPSRYNRHLGSNSHDIDRNGQHGLIPSTDNSSGVNSHTKDAVDGSEKYIRNLPNHSRGSRAGQNNRRQDYSYSRGSNPADYREYVGSLEASAKRATRARQNSILISAHIPETTDYGL